MKELKRFANYGFHISVVGVAFIALLIAFCASIDQIFDLKWGFSWKDFWMAAIVAVGSIIVRVLVIKIASVVGVGIEPHRR